MDLTPENQQKINDVLGYLLDSVQKVGDVAVDQLPLVAQEIVAWGFWSNLVSYLFVWLLFGVACSTVVTVVRKHSKLDDGYGGPNRHGFVVIASASIAVVTGIALMPMTFADDGPGQQALKSAIAPRLYVLDWLRGK